MSEQICRAALSGQHEEVQQMLAGGWNKDARCSPQLLLEAEGQDVVGPMAATHPLNSTHHPRARARAGGGQPAEAQRAEGAVATAVYLAARRGHTLVVSVLAEAGANLEARETGRQKTVLMAASESGDVECVQYLLERGGSDVSAVDTQHRTALDLTQLCQLHEGGGRGGYAPSVRSARVPRSSDPQSERDVHRRGALRATHSDPRDRRDRFSVSPRRSHNEGAHAAAVPQYGQVGALLLAYGAQASHLPEMDEHLCRVALSGQHEQIKQLLAGGWNKDARCSPQLLLEVEGQDVVRPMESVALDERNSTHHPRARARAWGGQPAEAQRAEGAVATAVYLAARRGHTLVVSVLAEAGANLEARETGRQKTVLMAASESGDVECVQYLLSQAAEVALTDKDGQTALDYAQACAIQPQVDASFHRSMLAGAHRTDSTTARHIKIAALLRSPPQVDQHSIDLLRRRQTLWRIEEVEAERCRQVRAGKQLEDKTARVCAQREIRRVLAQLRAGDEEATTVPAPAPAPAAPAAPAAAAPAAAAPAAAAAALEAVPPPAVERQQAAHRTFEGELPAAAVATLVRMGFSEERVTRALFACEGDATRAIDRLLADTDSDFVPPPPYEHERPAIDHLLVDPEPLPPDVQQYPPELEVAPDWIIPSSDVEVDESPAGLLGRGALGEVRKGMCRGMTVALKALHLLRTDAAAAQAMGVALTQEERRLVLESFRKECDLLRRACDHHNIVRFIGMVSDPEPLYLATEYCPSGTLQDLLYKPHRADLRTAEGGCLPLATQLLVSHGIFEALKFLATLPMIHRDVKPANILIVIDGAGVDTRVEKAMLTDFGEAKQMTQTMTVQSMAGTPVYMAPEMAAEEDEKGPKADVFSAVSFGLATAPCVSVCGFH
eukprot:COSAG02_NODE_1531_length_12086_cov_22.388588_7_plen_896_part_00